MSMDMGEIPAACKEACPAAEALRTEMQSKMSSMGSGAGIKQMLEGQIDLMCKHPDTMQCMETNHEVCDAPEHDEQGHDGHSHSDIGGTPDVAGMGECLCTHCPGLKDGIITFFDYMMKQMQSGMSNGGDVSAEADPTESMKMVCPLIGGLKCAMPQPSCASVMSGIPLDADIDTAEAGCKAMGISTGPAPAG